MFMIGDIRRTVTEQRVRRTVSGELALLGFMRSLNDMGRVIKWDVTVMSRTPNSSFDFGPELGALVGRIGNDVSARVALLEKGNCPCARTQGAVSIACSWCWPSDRCCSHP